MGSLGSPASVTYPRQFTIERSDQFCLVPDGCVQTEVFSLEPVLVLLWTGLFALLVVVAFVHIQRARTLIEKERKRTSDERDAFEEFGRRVSGIEAARSRATVQAQGSVSPIATAGSDGQLDRIKEAYRETVMAVPHYQEEYDEPLARNMSAEFNDELTAAVTDGPTLTPTVKEALVHEAEQARTRRDELIDQLDREAEDLDESRAAFTDIEETLSRLDTRPLSERSFDDLVHVWHQLSELEDRCTDRLIDRQRAIHRRSGPVRRSDLPMLQSYLYQPLAVSYPVLDAGTELAGKLRRARRRVIAALVRRA